MDEPVDRRDRNRMIGEDPVPGTEGLVGRNGNAPVLITPGNEFEQHGAFGPVLLCIGDVIENDQIELVELGQCGFKIEVSSGGLQSLDEIG